MTGIKRCAIILLIGLAFPGRAEEARFVFENGNGPHGVGLRIVNQYDLTRGFLGPRDLAGQLVPGERSRPIQTMVWYPAAGTSKPVSYRDYLLAAATRFQFAPSQAEIAGALERLEVPPLGPDLAPGHMARENARPMRAGLDAAPAPGRFPVVIYAPSLGGAAMENADLCEYLASHGYIVLASPSFGARSRTMTTDLEGAEAQAADIGFLAGYARSLPQAAPDGPAVVGFSWGGLSNVLAAARDSRIRALVCLDGGIRFAPEVLEEAKYATPDRIRVPVLFFASNVPPREAASVDDARFGRLLRTGLRFADVTLVTMPRMQHWHFSSYLLRFNPDSAFEGRSCREAYLDYGWMARTTLDFLDARLKGDAKARARLENPPAADLPGGKPSIAALPPHGFDVQALADQAGRRGFQQLQAAYEEGLREDPGGKPTEAQLKDWGFALLGQGRTPEAVAVFQLAVHLQPRSAPAHSRLAYALFRKGDWALARKAYLRALDLDPEDAAARRGMMRLDSMPQAPSPEAAGN